jgi:two-component system response regulator AtoC
MESCPVLRAPLAIVAEDDEASRHLLAAWLEHKGYEVVSACDGIDLLERLDALSSTGHLEEPFLIITDIDMPRCDGLSALALAGPRFPSAAAVVVTAFGDLATRQRARSLGASALLDKPFRLTELAETAAAALRAKSPQRQAGGSVIPPRSA